MIEFHFVDLAYQGKNIMFRFIMEFVAPPIFNLHYLLSLFGCAG
jgi:hypothetical protein